MTITIEKNIPMPARTRTSKYPFDKLTVGDSFFVQAKKGTLAAAANSAAKRLGWKFSVRVVEGGVRVWRVA